MPFKVDGIYRLGIAGFVVLGITLGLRAIAPGALEAPDFDGKNPDVEVIIDIPLGATGSDIARILAEKGVVKSELAFFRAAVADSRSARIAPGEHRIQTEISAVQALDQLLDPDRIVNLIRIRDGARLIEVVSALEDAGFNRSEIAKSVTELRPPALFKTQSIEGFLYPAFYAPTKGATSKEILSAALDRFQQDTTDIDWRYQDYTPLELMTIASIVESEGTPDVHRKVAQVIYNRLSKGMPLQMDSTVHYIFGRRGEIQLSIKDTKVRNRYNTFVNPGLPPGPIGSPTLASIEATLNPEPGPWLYFVTVSPKLTKFTDSYKEFLEFKAEYKRNLANGLFK